MSLQVLFLAPLNNLCDSTSVLVWGAMTVDHASGISAPKSYPGILHVKSAMTVIFTDMDGAWRMADVIWVDAGARNPKTPALFQVADVDTGFINWVNADFVTHILPRV